MTTIAALRRWSVAGLASYLLGRLAARILSARNLRAIDPAFTDFGGDD